MKSVISKELQKTVSKGDILIDCYGNKMVVLDPLEGNTGDCYVLLNGRVKLVNTMSSSIVKKEKVSINMSKEKTNG